MNVFVHARYHAGPVHGCPIAIGQSRRVTDQPGFLRRDHVDDVSLDHFAIHIDGHRRRIDSDVVAAEIRADPGHHAGIVFFPTLLEQRLFRERLLGIGDDDLGRRVGGLQDMRHHRNPFVRSGGTTVRIGRCHHDVGAALGHRVDLRLEQFGLAAALVGMRHGVLCRQVPTGNRAFDKVDAWAEDQTVIRHRSATRQSHGLGIAVHTGRPVMHNVDAVLRRQLAVGMGKAVQFPESAQIQVREKAGIIAAAGFDQRDVDLSGAVLGDVARGGCPACPAAHDNHLGFAVRGRVHHGGAQRRCGHPGAHKGTSVEFHGFLPFEKHTRPGGLFGGLTRLGQNTPPMRRSLRPTTGMPSSASPDVV